MTDSQKRVKHRPPNPASDYWHVPEVWRLAFERDVLSGPTKWGELRRRGLERAAVALLHKWATPGEEEWTLDVIKLIDRAIRAQRTYIKRKGDRREATFHSRARAARERIYGIPLPESNGETLKDLFRVATPPEKYRLKGWIVLLHEWRARFVKTCLDRGLLGPKYYLFLLRGVAGRHGVRLSLNNLTYLADCAEAAASSTYSARSKRSAPGRRSIQKRRSKRRRPKAGTDPTLNRETLSRFFKSLGRVEQAILDHGVPLLSDLLPPGKK